MVGTGTTLCYYSLPLHLLLHVATTFVITFCYYNCHYMCCHSAAGPGGSPGRTNVVAASAVLLRGGRVFNAAAGPGVGQNPLFELQQVLFLLAAGAP